MIDYGVSIQGGGGYVERVGQFVRALTDRRSGRVRARRELTCGFWDLTSQVNALSARMLFFCELLM